MQNQAETHLKVMESCQIICQYRIKNRETQMENTSKKNQKKLEALIRILKKSGFLNDENVEQAIKKSPRHELSQSLF